MSVWKYVKVDGVWRYKRAIEDKGKIIPNMVRVDGKVEFHEEGTYYFRSGRTVCPADGFPRYHEVVCARPHRGRSCQRDSLPLSHRGRSSGHGRAAVPPYGSYSTSEDGKGAPCTLQTSAGRL